MIENFGFSSFGAERVESIGEQNRAVRAGQRVHGDPTGQGLPVAVVLAPADFEVLEPGIVAIGRPDPAGDVRSLHGQTGMKRAVIDDVNGPGFFSGPEGDRAI